MITLAKNPYGLMATTVDGPRTAALAAAAYLTSAMYDLARNTPDPARTLDDIADELPEIMPGVLKTVGVKPDTAAALLPAITTYVWAFAAIEYARAEAGEGYGYIFDLLADNLRKGAEPIGVKTTALAVPGRIRELAEQAGGAL
ncbi:hypothetical protein ABZ235_38805 [Streptomyces canus]|uniref:hypothetical protein n=1 Tax=Streptomyces canus TaxID=58343 RepID=UPI00339E96EE